MAERFLIYQRMSGFIANSSGAAYFQFFMFEVPKSTTTDALLENNGIIPHSIAHAIVKDLGILEKIVNAKKLQSNFELFLEETCPDGYALESTRKTLLRRYKRLPNTDFKNNDYFAEYIGSGTDYDFNDDDQATLGFLYLLKFKEGSKCRFIAEDVYYRCY